MMSSFDRVQEELYSLQESLRRAKYAHLEEEERIQYLTKQAEGAEAKLTAGQAQLAELDKEFGSTEEKTALAMAASASYHEAAKLIRDSIPGLQVQLEKEGKALAAEKAALTSKLQELEDHRQRQLTVWKKMPHFDSWERLQSLQERKASEKNQTRRREEVQTMLQQADIKLQEKELQLVKQKKEQDQLRTELHTLQQYQALREQERMEIQAKQREEAVEQPTTEQENTEEDEEEEYQESREQAVMEIQAKQKEVEQSNAEEHTLEEYQTRREPEMMENQVAKQKEVVEPVTTEQQQQPILEVPQGRRQNEIEIQPTKQRNEEVQMTGEKSKKQSSITIQPTAINDYGPAIFSKKQPNTSNFGTDLFGIERNGNTNHQPSASGDLDSSFFGGFGSGGDNRGNLATFFGGGQTNQDKTDNEQNFFNFGGSGGNTGGFKGFNF